MTHRAARALDAAHVVAQLGESRVIDVRDRATFAAGHLAGSGHMPLAEFEERRAELPARSTPVLVVAGSGAEAAHAAHALVTRGFESVDYFDAPIEQLPGGCDDRSPARPLWRPSPLVEAIAPVLPRGRAADLACGSGRDAVFLALQGFTVEAWDHDEEALRSAKALAGRHGVTLTAVECDLEGAAPGLEEERYDLIVCVRFLHRPLFPTIERALAPGGHLIYETFRVGQEHHGKPRRAQFLLESEELLSAFPLLDVVRYVETNPPGGPVMAGLVAKKSGKPKTQAARNLD